MSCSHSQKPDEFTVAINVFPWSNTWGVLWNKRRGAPPPSPGADTLCVPCYIVRSVRKRKNSSTLLLNPLRFRHQKRSLLQCPPLWVIPAISLETHFSSFIFYLLIFCPITFQFFSFCIFSSLFLVFLSIASFFLYLFFYVFIYIFLASFFFLYSFFL